MKSFTLIALIVFICVSCTQTEKHFLDTKDAYFGLTPPGLIPEVFAPGIVSDSTWAEHCQLAVSPKGDEIYWSAWSSKYPPADTSMKNSEQIYFSEFKDGEWTLPAIAEFIKEHLTCLNGGPSFSPDGNRLYFYSTGIEGGFGNKDVWYVDRTKGGWSKPTNAGEPLNTEDGDWTPSFTKNGYAYHMGNYYYNENEKPLKFKYSNGIFSDPEPVIIHPDFTPVFAIYVSPDESYMIFSGLHKDGFGSLDLYVCFKTKDDKWGTPINMGDQINTEKIERFPVVSPDGKYLFFMRHTPGQDIFWVSTKIIDDLRKKECCSHKKQEKEIPDNAFPIVYRGHLYIVGEADSIKGNYIFDTGASNFYFDSTYYSHNDFQYTNLFTAKLPGAGTTVQNVEVVHDTVTFRFGKYLYQTNNVPILKLKPIVGDFADGIIGMEYFSNSVMEINYEKEYISLFQSLDSVDLSGFSRIGISRRGNRLFIPMKVSINDTLIIAGEYQIDFGAGGSIALTSSVAHKYNLMENIEKKTPFFTKYGGVGGESSSYDFMAKSIEIGEFQFNNVTMEFSVDKSGAMASEEHLGLLGNGIYSRFTVIIDFINNDFYLKPNSKYNEPFEFSRLGFSYVDRNQTMNAWIVTGLYRGSNAEEQGLRIDDKIIAVNGVSIHEIDYKSQKNLFKELSDIVLTIEREGKVKEIQYDLKPIQ